MSAHTFIQTAHVPRQLGRGVSSYGVAKACIEFTMHVVWTASDMEKNSTHNLLLLVRCFMFLYKLKDFFGPCICLALKKY